MTLTLVTEENPFSRIVSNPNTIESFDGGGAYSHGGVLNIHQSVCRESANAIFPHLDAFARICAFAVVCSHLVIIRRKCVFFTVAAFAHYFSVFAFADYSKSAFAHLR